MSIFEINMYEKRQIVRIIAAVDIGHSLLYIAINFFNVVFGSAPESEQRGYPFITLFTIVIMCFYLLHVTLAITLLTGLEMEKTDPLTSARKTKVWQNWAIVYLIFLVGNSFSNILSAHSWLSVFFVSGLGVVEILWRLVGIYNIGIYIDDLLEQISYATPTIKFFSVRFPIPMDCQDDLNKKDELSSISQGM